MELMLKLGFFFFSFLTSLADGAEKGRGEVKGAINSRPGDSAPCRETKASDVSSALSLTFKLRVCFSGGFRVRALS